MVGGGWFYTRDLFVVTTDDKLYYAEKFGDDLLDCDLMYVCDLYGSVDNVCIRSSFNGEERKYLYDLLDADGKVDFEDYKEDTSCSMDSMEITLYKNEDGILKKLMNCYDFDCVPAVEYISVLFSMNKSRIKG